MDAWLPVLVETLDVLVKEGKTVCNPFLQDGNLFFVGTDTIVSEHTDRIEATVAHTEATARETTSTKTAKSSKTALGLGSLLRGFCPLGADEQFRVFLEVSVLGLCQESGIIFDKVENLRCAEDGLAEFLIAGLDCLPESRVLQQTLPHGWGGVGAGTLKAPRLQIVGIGEITVAVGEVVVPHRACLYLAACTIGMQLLLEEIGTALVAVGIQAQFGVDEIVDERRHINKVGIAFLGIHKVIRLYGYLH